MRLKWCSAAIEDLIALREFIAEDNPAAAEVASRILKSVAMLADQPGIGRSGRVEGTKELVFSGMAHLSKSRIG